MKRLEAAEVMYWRSLDRTIQNVEDHRRQRAQSVIDLAEATRLTAEARDEDPLDHLLHLMMVVSSPGAKRLVAAAMAYLRAETQLLGRERGPRPTSSVALGM